MTTADSTTGGELESLEQEREFLLRSLADLDAEYHAGDIDDRDYRTLTDDYTARAAAVLHAIDALSSPPPSGTASRSSGTAPARSTSARSARSGRSGRSATATATATASTGTMAAVGRGTQTARNRASRLTSSKSRGRADGVSGRVPRGRPRTPAPAAGATGPSAEAAAGDDDDDFNDDSDYREPRGGPAPLEAALRSRRRWRRGAIGVAVLAFGVVAIWAVSQSSGSRQPGQTVTGNAQITGSTVAGGVDPRLVDASNLVNQGKVADALKEYDAILKDDPNQPVALAYGGWLEAQAGMAANRTDLVDDGLAQIVKSEQVSPTFTDPHFFRGFLLLRAKNDAAGAVTEFRYYLGAIDPTSPQVAQVQSLLQEAIKAAGSNVPAGPNAPTTTAGPPTTTHP